MFYFFSLTPMDNYELKKVWQATRGTIVHTLYIVIYKDGGLMFRYSVDDIFYPAPHHAVSSFTDKNLDIVTEELAFNLKSTVEAMEAKNAALQHCRLVRA